MTGNASVQPLREITPQNLSRVIDQLGDGEKITISRIAGKISVSITGIAGGVARTEQVKQRLFTALNPMPVAPGWMSQIELPTETQTAAYKERAKEKKKAGEHSSTVKDMVFSALDMELFSMSIGDATIFQSASTQYMMFQIGKFQAFTSMTNTTHTVMYKEGDSNEFKYR